MKTIELVVERQATVALGQDYDKYRLTIPAPLAVELDSDEAWREFQEASAAHDASNAETVFGNIDL